MSPWRTTACWCDVFRSPIPLEVYRGVQTGPETGPSNLSRLDDPLRTELGMAMEDFTDPYSPVDGVRWGVASAEVAVA